MSAFTALGLKPDTSMMALATQVERGLPLSALDRLVRQVPPDDSTFAYRLVPKPILARRRAAQARLTPEESARLARLAEIWAQARATWGSDDASGCGRADPRPRPDLLAHRRPQGRVPDL